MQIRQPRVAPNARLVALDQRGDLAAGFEHVEQRVGQVEGVVVDELASELRQNELQ